MDPGGRALAERLRSLGYTEVKATGVDLNAKKVVINGAYDLLSKMKNSEEGD